jgi:glycosyltransferase involved in cell wall biosynthesis
MSKPLVSILMNCFNGQAYLIVAQTYDNWEIIFWDNCSTDKSAEIAKSYDKRLRYFRGETNIPLYAARNLALEKVHGDIIAFLDVDDIWYPEKLTKQIPFFNDSEVGLVYSDTHFIKDAKIISRYFENKDFYTGHCFENLFDNYFLSLETVLVRKAAMQQANLKFNEKLSHMGDADLFRRIGFKWKYAMINEPLSAWRVHAESLSWKKHESFFQETEHLIEIYKKDFPEFTTKYSHLLAFMERDALVGKVKYLLVQSKYSEVRKLVWSKVFSVMLWGKKFFLLVVLSFLPGELAKKIVQKKLMAQH